MNEKPPFNDVGGIPSKADLKKMPKPIQLIGYFMIGCGAIFILVQWVFKHPLD